MGVERVEQVDRGIANRLGGMEQPKSDWEQSAEMRREQR